MAIRCSFTRDILAPIPVLNSLTLPRVLVPPRDFTLENDIQSAASKGLNEGLRLVPYVIKCIKLDRMSC